MNISVTKIEAARRQLNEAIRLWFFDGDPIAIHSLACSAHQIVHDINQRQGWRDLLYDSLIIKDEYRKEWAKKLKTPFNFLKHADNDPTGVLEFKTEMTELFIFYTLFGLELIGQKHDDIGGAFIIYLNFHRPELLTEKGKLEFYGKFSEETLEIGRSLSKEDFFNFYIKLKSR